MDLPDFSQRMYQSSNHRRFSTKIEETLPKSRQIQSVYVKGGLLHTTPQECISTFKLP